MPKLLPAFFGNAVPWKPADLARPAAPTTNPPRPDACPLCWNFGRAIPRQTVCPLCAARRTT